MGHLYCIFHLGSQLHDESRLGWSGFSDGDLSQPLLQVREHGQLVHQVIMQSALELGEHTDPEVIEFILLHDVFTGEEVVETDPGYELHLVN